MLALRENTIFFETCQAADMDDSYPAHPRTAIGEMVAATKGMGFRLNWAMGIRHRGGENGKEAEGGDIAVQGGAK